MNAFFSNLFGSIAGSAWQVQTKAGMQFIPFNNSGGTIQIAGQKAVWLGLQNRLMQKYAYEFCYPLASVIDRLAEADLNGEVEIYNAKGKGKDKMAMSSYATRLRKLLEQPNPLQSWEQFRGQQLVYKRTFGFCPVLPIMPAGMESGDPSYCLALINLPPWNFEAIPTGKFFGQSALDGLVKEYVCTMLNNRVTFTPDQLFILEDSFFQDEQTNFMLPKSRLVGLDMAVSNLCAAMEADNVLLRKRGPLGFISHDAAATKDAVAGYLPMTPDEKTELQNSLSEYGLNLEQFQYAISRQAVKWNPMSYDVKGLGTKETIVASEKAVCHRFGYSYILYEDSGATFANQSGAHKALYQNVIIPNAEKDFCKYNKFFKADENGIELEIDFSELPIMQEDELMKAQAAKAWDEALLTEYKVGLITKNMWLAARGMEPMPVGGDEYYTAPAPVDMNTMNQNTNQNGTQQNQGTQNQGQPS